MEYFGYQHGGGAFLYPWAALHRYCAARQWVDQEVSSSFCGLYNGEPAVNVPRKDTKLGHPVNVVYSRHINIILI